MENMKKLERDTQNKVIGGVCSGLANYFDIDAALVRVLFAFALLAFSAGFWLYLILWIVMPAATSVNTSQFAEVADQEAQKPAPNKSGITAGLILIIVGACFLLGNLVPQFTWKTFWPVVLIVFGVMLIVPHKDKKS